MTFHAGVPVSVFFANLYLAEADAYFLQRGVNYARYGDDIVIFADTKQEIEDCRLALMKRLDGSGLKVNREKERLYFPDSGSSIRVHETHVWRLKFTKSVREALTETENCVKIEKS